MSHQLQVWVQIRRRLDPRHNTSPSVGDLRWNGEGWEVNKEHVGLVANERDGASCAQSQLTVTLLIAQFTNRQGDSDQNFA